MNIYFCGSIRGEAVNKAFFRTLINHLKTYGPVLTEHIGYEIPEAKEVTDEEIYNRDMKWLESADVVIAECSSASLGVGFELAYAQVYKKPTMTLYNSTLPKKMSGMIAGCEYFKNCQYTTEEEAIRHIDEFLATFRAAPSSN
eukprot:TRINITY_DN7339_c0_g1_i1.p1 TRINITY_DN7339_c0_g1~~TRINITY_DN7339_c0_g1_i1.p1  ORF type:complete len:162 (+),score=42.30 TRINITY_DN7339_c0_g1_i1:58-486(+)